MMYDYKLHLVIRTPRACPWEQSVKSNEEYINDRYKGMSPKIKRPLPNDLSNKKIVVSDNGERRV